MLLPFALPSWRWPSNWRFLSSNDRCSESSANRIDGFLPRPASAAFPACCSSSAWSSSSSLLLMAIAECFFPKVASINSPQIFFKLRTTTKKPFHQKKKPPLSTKTRCLRPRIRRQRQRKSP
uniref:(northern house mosquito) hypothetical protein n=1 Tax=Culex pipiens TaxID=7175 RepID=A0A8D8FS12_CULPI